jgi:hypothetical protein
MAADSDEDEDEEESMGMFGKFLKQKSITSKAQVE